MRARTRRTLGRNKQSGAAMVEAVIALPLLLALLIGVPYVQRLYAAHLQTLSEARYGAFKVASAACDGSAPALSMPDSANAVDEHTKTHAQASSGSDFKRITDIPVVGFMIGIIVPKLVEHRETRTLDKPVLFGGDEAVVSRELTLMCNEKPTTPTKVASDLFTSLICKASGLFC